MKRRVTKQRELIIKVLENNRTHPTADWIYEKVKKEIPDISKGTVYRNLQVLLEDGVITELNLDGILARYEEKQKTHYHFKCEKCGRVIDLDEPVLQGINERVAKKTGFKVSGHQAEFHGLCKNCQ
jgi:Fur family transcriptional regulator, peroxide stress response regulator